MSFTLAAPLDKNYLNSLNRWKVNGRLELTVGSDVGASGIRLRFSNAADSTQHIDFPHIKCQTTHDCAAALKHIERFALKLFPDLKVESAAMGVAGRLSRDKGSIVVTNWKGSVRNRSLSIADLDSRLFPKEKSFILNDLEAAAYGMIDSQLKGKLDEYFQPMWPDRIVHNQIISKSRTMLIDAGTGIGVAVIERTPLLKLPYVFATELGHLQVPINRAKAATHDLEFRLTQYISDEMYEGKQPPEFEDIASGRGIPVVYQFLNLNATGKKIPLNDITADYVAGLARAGDKVAYQTMMTHHQFLLRASKSIATSLSCENVLLALENQVKNDWFVQKEKEKLAEEFYNFIRPDWMTHIQVFTQRKPYNFTLRGAIWLAHTRLKK